MKKLTEQGYSFTAAAERVIARGVKEKPCYTSADYDTVLVYLASIATRSRRRTRGAYLLLQTPTVGGTQFIFYMVELARFMVDSLSF